VTPDVCYAGAAQILGVDVMLDKKLKPWLVECNIMPSYATDSTLDAEVKGRLISQVLAAVTAQSTDEASYELAVEETQEEVAETTEKQWLQSHKDRLHACFKRHAPEKVGKVDALMAKYEGQEEDFVARVERKYSFGRVDMNRPARCGPINNYHIRKVGARIDRRYVTTPTHHTTPARHCTR